MNLLTTIEIENIKNRVYKHENSEYLANNIEEELLSCPCGDWERINTSIYANEFIYRDNILIYIEISGSYINRLEFRLEV